MVRTLGKHPSLFSLAVVLVALPIVLKSSWLTVSAAAAVTTPPDGFAATVSWVGLGPVELASAGLSSTQTTAVVEDVLAEWNADPDALPDAQADYVSAKQEKQRLERLVRSGRATASEVTALHTAISDFAYAESARQVVLDALFDAGVADLSTDEVDCLETIRDNAGQTAPIEYRVVTRTESEWLDLDEALANESIAAEYGETPAAECVTHVATVRSDSDVSAAMTACDTNLSAVRTAWDAATGN